MVQQYLLETGVNWCRPYQGIWSSWVGLKRSKRGWKAVVVKDVACGTTMYGRCVQEHEEVLQDLRLRLKLVDHELEGVWPKLSEDKLLDDESIHETRTNGKEGSVALNIIPNLYGSVVMTLLLNLLDSYATLEVSFISTCFKWKCSPLHCSMWFYFLFFDSYLTK